MSKRTQCSQVSKYAYRVRMVLSQRLLRPIEGPLVPHQGLVVLALVLQHQGHVVDSGESVRMVLSQCLLQTGRQTGLSRSAKTPTRPTVGRSG
jgi:hypothetical protein